MDGLIRYETRNDDEFFYPEKVTSQGKELTWPEGVRRFSYRKDFDIPSGNGKHNVQIAFNVIPPEQKAYLQHPRRHDAALLRLLRHRLRVRPEQGRRSLRRRHGDLLPPAARHDAEALLPAPAQGARSTAGRSRARRSWW